MADGAFDLSEVKTLLDGINKDFSSYKEKNDDRLKQIEEKGSADYVTTEALEKIEADLSKKQQQVDQIELAMKRKPVKVMDKDGNEIDLDAKAIDWAKIVAKDTGMVDEAKSFDHEGMQEYKGAFLRLARKAFNTDFLTDAERKALSVGSSSDGGFFVTPDMTGRMVQRVYETSAVRAYASVQVISTDTLEGFYDNDEVGFGWVSELESRPTTDTPQVARWSIPVHEMYAMPKASQKLLDDSAVDIEEWLSGKIGDRFARAENSAFVAGDGVGKPRGFLDYADGTDLTNSVERFQTGANGAFATAPTSGDVLISALYGLKAQYRSNATWFANTATQAAVRKLKDSDGKYLWQPGIAGSQPATILGAPVASFEDMPNLATGSLSMAVGDLRQAYQIVDRMGVRMLRDPFTSKPNILFYATKRTGGDMINGEAIKVVEFSS
ncbi:MAG: phage major capsid protein [Celeribacter sp.]|jgi:HK97 family phage major capsid protein